MNDLLKLIAVVRLLLPGVPINSHDRGVIDEHLADLEKVAGKVAKVVSPAKPKPAKAKKPAKAAPNAGA
jgi:hypothetical protein